MSLDELSLRREEVSEKVSNNKGVWYLERNGVLCLKSRTLKAIREYVQGHYLVDLNKEKKNYYSRLIMLQLENGESLDWVRKQLDHYLSQSNREGLPEALEQPKSVAKPVEEISINPSPLLSEIIEGGKEVYKEMGWGWGESAYREALCLELEARGYRCSQEVSVPILYRGRELSHVNSRIDILARLEGVGIIIELKSDSASRMSMERAWCQCQRYLRITGHQLGIVINFPDKETNEIEYRY